MKNFPSLPNPAIVFILQYLSNDPQDIIPIMAINKTFLQRFHIQDYELWTMIGKNYHISLPIKSSSSSSSSSLRSKSNYRKLFFNYYYKKLKTIIEKHDYLILISKNLLQKPKDQPNQLKKLILQTFPDEDFNHYFQINWRSSLFENNSLLTLASRYCHIKTMKLLVDGYSSHIDLADMGGFTSLIICAYHGFMEGVQFCIKRGADIYIKGKLRSGVALTAEHWSAVRGHFHVFYYLRSIRIRDQNKRKILPSTTTAPATSSISPTPSMKRGGSMNSNDPTMINSSFNYDNATFDEIFFIGNQPTNQNVQQLLLNNQQCCSSVTPSTAAISNGNTSSSQGGSFCICGRGFVGKMIACDMAGCEVEWFHFECVGLSEEPTGSWTCPACRGESFHLPDLRIFNRNNKESHLTPSTSIVTDSNSDHHRAKTRRIEEVSQPSLVSTTNLNQLTVAVESSVSISSTEFSVNLVTAVGDVVANTEGSFCVCGEGFVGKMIGCDADDCDIEWFHFKCVGLSKTVSLFSSVCRNLSPFNSLKVDGCVRDVLQRQATSPLPSSLLTYQPTTLQ